MRIVEACRHCDPPPCLSACTRGAIRKRSDGSVYVDGSCCAGCGDCVEDCPFGARFLSPDDGISETWYRCFVPRRASRPPRAA